MLKQLLPVIMKLFIPVLENSYKKEKIAIGRKNLLLYSTEAFGMDIILGKN